MSQESASRGPILRHEEQASIVSLYPKARPVWVRKSKICPALQASNSVKLHNISKNNIVTKQKSHGMAAIPKTWKKWALIRVWNVQHPNAG